MSERDYSRTFTPFPAPGAEGWDEWMHREMAAAANYVRGDFTTPPSRGPGWEAVDAEVLIVEPYAASLAVTVRFTAGTGTITVPG